MRDFSFNGVSLSSFGGRITEAPMHTIATRDKSFVKIYGQSGDEVIDNGSYNNVDFSVKIGFLKFVSNQTAEQLARAVIDWLAPLQSGYYEYRDTYNDGYFTRAAMTNFEEIEREMRTFLTATLKFSRVPFWYSDVGQLYTTVYSSSEINNPEIYTSEPVYELDYPYKDGISRDVTITVNGFSVVTESLVYPRIYYFDTERKQNYYISNEKKVYFSKDLLPNFSVGNNTVTVRTGSLSQSSVTLKIKPNWRRL